MRVVFVHGACVRDVAWWWHRTGELLAAQGVPSITPSLPSCSEAGRAAGSTGPGLSEDIAAVREHLLDGAPTIVVAHSYGGIVCAEAAADLGSVEHLLLISSYLPEIGESLASFGDGTPAPFLDINVLGGTFAVRQEMLAETFLQDCDTDIVAQAPTRLARQSLSVIGQPVTAAAWKHIPTTYLVCAQDRGTPADRQRAFARRASTVIEIDAGHHPFLAQPAAVCDLLLSR